MKKINGIISIATDIIEIISKIKSIVDKKRIEDR